MFIDIPTEYLIAVVFSIGVYVARNEFQHRDLKKDVEQLKEHFNIPKRNKKLK